MDMSKDQRHVHGRLMHIGMQSSIMAASTHHEQRDSQEL